jgi:Fur family peroxide stress response transcriptional regulator
VKTKRRPLASAAERIERMVAALRAGGLRITPQRIAVIRELADDPTHPTAQELFERLRPQLPTMSFATVYNTLAALAEQGLCAARALATEGERGPVRFDPNVMPHDHAVCDACGLVLDVMLDDRSTRRANPLEGFAVRAVEKIYRGLCAKCADRSRQARGADQDQHRG